MKPTSTFSGIIPARFGNRAASPFVSALTMDGMPGHSMVLDNRTRTLYIFGGKLASETGNKFGEHIYYDMYAYHIATKTTRQLFADIPRDSALDAAFTQRAVIDPQLQEIYVYAFPPSQYPPSST
jgi:hypothetical protein